MEKTFQNIPPFIGAESKVENKREIITEHTPPLLPSLPAQSRIFWCGRPERRKTTPQYIPPFMGAESRVEKRHE
jgi:hypothetical protein